MKVYAYEYSQGRVLDILESDDSDVFVSQTRKNFTLPADFVARHAGNFVFGADGDASIPPARYSTRRELAPHLFQIEKTGNGLYAIKNVPLYKAHADTRRYGIECDEKFLDRMVRNFYTTHRATAELFGTDKFSWRPKLHWGHTPDDANIEERENAGFIDNLFRVEDFLIGDYIGLDKATLDKLVSGKYPDRSAEVDLRRARLLSVAALGYRTPHFALPQMNPSELREKYLAVIQKNAGELKGVESHVFLQEDFGMPATAKTKRSNRQREELSAEEVAKFFLDLGQNEEANNLFESLVDKHCDMMGGMMPGGGSLMAIIQQVMQSMMGNRMNQSPPGQAGQAGQQQQGGYGQHTASDALDLESRAHHGAGEEDLDEEGTDVAEGKRGEDAGVKKDGQPDVDSPDYDTVSEGGSVVKKHVVSRINRAKNTLKTLKDSHTREQLSAVLDDFGSAFEAQSDFIEKQHETMTALTKQFNIQKNARRRDAYTRRFEKMFTQGNPNAANKELVAKHMKILMNMGDEALAEEYLTNLEAAPCLPKGRHVSQRELVEPEGSENRIERANHTLNKNRGLKRAGVTARHLLAIDDVDALLNDGEEEDSDDLL